jgi:hypothetical protein
MQANQRVYCLAAVGRLLLSGGCDAMRDLPLSKRPRKGDPGQPTAWNRGNVG